MLSFDRRGHYSIVQNYFVTAYHTLNRPAGLGGCIFSVNVGETKINISGMSFLLFQGGS